VTENIAGTRNIDWKNMGFLFLGIALFTVVYLAPAWPDAIDPMGKHFPLNREAKGAIAVFLLAATWWVFEVVRRLYGFYGALGYVYFCLDYDRAGIHQDRLDQTSGVQNAGHRG
jgi:hypothetical protein